MIFFAKRMLEIRPLGIYADIMEREFYNGTISGIQLDGKQFFYVNPLEVNPGTSGTIFGYKHVLPTRPGWYACACCPPNLVRLVTSLGTYAWSESDTTLYSHLFLGQTADFEKAVVKVDSSYPWEGKVTYQVKAKMKDAFELAIHIPSHIRMDTLCVTVNGEKTDAASCIKDGYLYLKQNWGENDVIELTFDLPVRKIYANTNVREDEGCVALMRGPVVYCFEGVDNGQLGTLKDPDHGIYPMVTSSSTLAGYGAVGAGLPPYEIKQIVTVCKAYSSAVGAGAFVSEIFGDEADELRRRGGDGGEFGATTGRPRRMGWFDCVASKYGCRLQGTTDVAFTVLDVLGYLDEIPVCTGYEIDGKVTTEFPTTTLLEKAKPVLETLPGWKCDIRGIKKYEDLPENCRKYVEFVEKHIGFPITMISNGPGRDDIIYRNK